LSRYELTLKDNVVVDVQNLDDEDEELIGLEWALREIKDTYEMSGSVTASFTLADKSELDELLGFLDRFFGEDHDANVSKWRSI
jgi:hypothetical protein